MNNEDILHQVKQQFEHLKAHKALFTENEYDVELRKLRVKLSSAIMDPSISKKQLKALQALFSNSIKI